MEPKVIKLAVVEDELTLASNYRTYFSAQGWDVAVYSNRQSARAGILRNKPDIAVLDVGLGEEEEGGFHLCRDLRKNAETATLGIVILTAREEQDDRILGLNIGADDYCSKSESLDYIVAVIKSLHRRIEFRTSDISVDSETISQGHLFLELNNEYASWKGQRLDLTRLQFQMVVKLARYPGMLKRKDDLMRDGSITSDATVRKISVD